MAKASKQIIQQHEEMFYPTVRVRTKKAGGSGTVVYSENTKMKYILILLLTNTLLMTAFTLKRNGIQF